MEAPFKGILIEESLDDPRILNLISISKVRITSDNPLDRWHIYTLKATKEEINNLSNHIKQGWYMHFWRGTEVIVIFNGQRFEFRKSDKSAWQSVTNYGLFVGIPREQLDFPMG